MPANVTTRIEGGFDTGTISASATVPIPAYSRVSLGTDGTYSVSPATEVGDGVLDRLVTVAGDGNCRIHLRNAPGSKFGIANGAVASAGLTLYAFANGQVSTTNTGGNSVIVGRSKIAAAAGGIVEYFSRPVI